MGKRFSPQELRREIITVLRELHDTKGSSQDAPDEDKPAIIEGGISYLKELLAQDPSLGKNGDSLVDRAAGSSEQAFEVVYKHFAGQIQQEWPSEKYAMLMMQFPCKAGIIFKSIAHGHFNSGPANRDDFFAKLTDMLMQGRGKRAQETTSDLQRLIKRDDDFDYQQLVDMYVEFFKNELSDPEQRGRLIRQGIRSNARYLTRQLAKMEVRDKTSKRFPHFYNALASVFRHLKIIPTEVLNSDNILTLIALIIAIAPESTDKDSLHNDLALAYVRMIQAEK